MPLWAYMHTSVNGDRLYDTNLLCPYQKSCRYVAFVLLPLPRNPDDRIHCCISLRHVDSPRAEALLGFDAQATTRLRPDITASYKPALLANPIQTITASTVVQAAEKRNSHVIAFSLFPGK